jgi:hypothetical protein
VPSAPSLATCVDRSGSASVVAGFFRFTETFAGGLRTVVQEAPNATNGTQVRIVIANLPANITILMPTGNVSTGNTELAYRSGLSTTAATGFTNTYTPASGDPMYAGSYAAVTGEVIYEVVTANTSSVDTLNVPFIVRYTAGPSVGTGTATARGTLAPLSTTTSFPRFADVGQTVTLLTSSVCRTTLLFPYVTTDGGFDTGVAISNTTTDTSGTAAQTGACSLNAFGSYTTGQTVPAAGTTGTIASGRTWANSLTVGTMFAGGTVALGGGFSGYMIAVCDFQLAHGYAFISDLGARLLAQGYLALVIPGGTRTGLLTTGNAVESLNN